MTIVSGSHLVDKTSYNNNLSNKPSFKGSVTSRNDNFKINNFEINLDTINELIKQTNMQKENYNMETQKREAIREKYASLSSYSGRLVDSTPDGKLIFEYNELPQEILDKAAQIHNSYEKGDPEARAAVYEYLRENASDAKQIEGSVEDLKYLRLSSIPLFRNLNEKTATILENAGIDIPRTHKGKLKYTSLASIIEPATIKQPNSLAGRLLNILNKKLPTLDGSVSDYNRAKKKLANELNKLGKEDVAERIVNMSYDGTSGIGGLLEYTGNKDFIGDAMYELDIKNASAEDIVTYMNLLEKIAGPKYKNKLWW